MTTDDPGRPPRPRAPDDPDDGLFAHPVTKERVTFDVYAEALVGLYAQAIRKDREELEGEEQ